MGNRRLRLALLLSGLRWRAGTSLAMFAVAVFAVAAGAFGPMYLHSADQSILNGVLRDAPTGNTGLTFEANSGNGSPTRLLSAAGSVPQSRRWFGNPISTDLAGLTSVAGSQPFTASLVSRWEYVLTSKSWRVTVPNRRAWSC